MHSFLALLSKLNYNNDKPVLTFTANQIRDLIAVIRYAKSMKDIPFLFFFFVIFGIRGLGLGLDQMRYVLL